jgi:hypothetical protein
MCSFGEAEKHSAILPTTLLESSAFSLFSTTMSWALCMWPTPIIFLEQGQAVMPSTTYW